MVFESIRKSLATGARPAILRNVKLPRIDLGPVTNQPIGNITNDNPTAINCAFEVRRALKNFGIFEIINHSCSNQCVSNMFDANENFFNKPLNKKQEFIQNGQSYSGYISRHYELTNEKEDCSEIFTVTPDIDRQDERVKLGVPCHGPTDWPSNEFKHASMEYLDGINNIGRLMVKLIAISLDLDCNYFDKFVTDPFTHMRVLNFAGIDEAHEKGYDVGIHSHTDYGFLIIAAQNEVSGLYVRPPIYNEYRPCNHNIKSTQTLKTPAEAEAMLTTTVEFENGFDMDTAWDDDLWLEVLPCNPNDNVLTVFVGDFMQYVTCNEYLSLPHKIKIDTNNHRRALATFFDPNFDSYHTPIYGKNVFDKDSMPLEKIHYGQHVTKIFMRSYPNSQTTKNIIENNSLPLVEYSKYINK